MSINLCLQKWLACNFSPENPYIIQQTGNENTQNYHVQVVTLIEPQILLTHLRENV